MSSFPSRRTFLNRTVAATLLGPAAALSTSPPLAADEAKAYPRLRKAVKFGMIDIKGSVLAKFELIKSLGFEGVELDSPSGVNRDEALAAKRKTGIDIHGVVDSIHWDVRLSDPDAAVRAKGLQGRAPRSPTARVLRRHHRAPRAREGVEPEDRELRPGLAAIGRRGPQGDPGGEGRGREDRDRGRVERLPRRRRSTS